MEPNSDNNIKKENDEIDLIEVFRKIWDGRKTIYKWMAVFFVIGIIVVIGSPKEYKSEVTLLVETGSYNSGMGGLLQQFGGLAGLNLGNNSGEDALTPKLYPDVVKSTPFLLDILNQKVVESKYDSTLLVSEYLQRYTKTGVASFVKDYTIGLPGKIIGLLRGNSKNDTLKGGKIKIFKLSAEQSGAIDQLSNRIEAKSGEASSTFVISVEMQDPYVATLLVDSVVKNLTKYIIDYRTQKAKNDLEFIIDRHYDAEKRYIISQRALAGFKDRNKNVILAAAQTTEQNLQAEYNLAFNLYNTLSQQLEQAKMKVQEKTPVFKFVEPAKVPLKKNKPKSVIILLGFGFLGVIFGIGHNIIKNFKSIYVKF